LKTDELRRLNRQPSRGPAPAAAARSPAPLSNSHTSDALQAALAYPLQYRRQGLRGQDALCTVAFISIVHQHDVSGPNARKHASSERESGHRNASGQRRWAECGGGSEQRRTAAQEQSVGERQRFIICDAPG
jgi:hypothetical protein